MTRKNVNVKEPHEPDYQSYREHNCHEQQNEAKRHRSSRNEYRTKNTVVHDVKGVVQLTKELVDDVGLALALLFTHA